MYQENYIGVKIGEGLGIFDNHYRYPEIDDHKKYTGHKGNGWDIQGIKVHSGKFQKVYKLLHIDIIDESTRDVLASANADTDVKGSIFIDHRLFADEIVIRRCSPPMTGRRAIHA